jgi:MerR family transcriptional regulator/heat shock protein HspR
VTEPRDAHSHFPHPPYLPSDEHPADRPVYVISVAAELAGMHPQTLRQYDRVGLVSPRRTAGRGRRYSARDIATLRAIQRMSRDEGISLTGIRRVLELEAELAAVRAQLAVLQQRTGVVAPDAATARRVFLAGRAGDVVDMRERRTRSAWFGRPRQLESGPDDRPR